MNKYTNCNICNFIIELYSIVSTYIIYGFIYIFKYTNIYMQIYKYIYMHKNDIVYEYMIFIIN